jgi:hypothetical protein
MPDIRGHCSLIPTALLGAARRAHILPGRKKPSQQPGTDPIVESASEAMTHDATFSTGDGPPRERP